MIFFAIEIPIERMLTSARLHQSRLGKDRVFTVFYLSSWRGTLDISP